MADDLVSRLRDYVDNVDHVPLRVEAAAEIERLREANSALETVAFAAWNALNEIHHDAAGMEADLFKALEAYGTKPDELWQAENNKPEHK